jgi:transposase
MHYIESENRHQCTMGYCLDEIITLDNAVRIVDAIIEEIYKANSKRFDKKGKSELGRKAYKPTTLLKLYLYGYINSISSSRKLESETHRNLEMIWLLGNLKPDHKTISDYRKDNGDAIRFVTLEFRRFLKDRGYIEGKTVGIDGSKIKANANRDMLTLEKIARRTKRLEEQLEKYLTELSSNDTIDDLEDEIENREFPENLDKTLVKKIVTLQQKIEKLEEEKKYLQETGRTCCSPSDHDAVLMKTRDGKLPAYNLETAVDNKNKMIVVAEVTTDTSDINQLEPTVDKLKEQLELVPEEVPADKGFYNINQIENIEKSGKTKCYVPPVEDKIKKRDEEAGISFIYDINKDEYMCSEGRTLVLIHKNKNKRNIIVDAYQCKECRLCKKKENCTESKVGRIIHRRKEQIWLDKYKERMTGVKAKLMKQLRKELVEHPFGVLKCWMGKIPILLRSKPKVQIEIDIYTTCYNLKRLINIENQDTIIEMIRKYRWKVA